MKLTGVIEIKNPVVKERSGTAKRTGNPYHMRWQTAVAQVGDEIRNITLNLEEGQVPFPVGRFKVDCPLYVDNFGNLAVSSRDWTIEPHTASKAA